MRHRITLALLLLGTNAGCVGHYLYQSEGTVESAGGDAQAALLYWYGDDGRLWYGKRYTQIDSTISMIVCGSTPKQFDGGGADDPVMIKSRPGDRQVIETGEDGGLVPVLEPQPLPPGSNCGEIAESGVGQPSSALEPGMSPVVNVLCDNPSRPQRYPAAGTYRFDAISRIKVRENVPPEDICASP